MRRQTTSPIALGFAKFRVGVGRNSGFTKVYADNMHKDCTVRATVRKHSQEGDDDTDYAIAEGGQLFVGCGAAASALLLSAVKC